MAVCALLSALFLSGCSEPSPEFAPVTGVVRINGKPERGLLVRFSPDPEKGNNMPAVASATTDDQGNYTLKYEFRGQEGDGAPVGWHRVSVSDTKVGVTLQGQRPKPSAVPYVYGRHTSTPFVFEVKAGEQNKIDLEVKK
jgi:hypothetical protein